MFDETEEPSESEPSSMTEVLSADPIVGFVEFIVSVCDFLNIGFFASMVVPARYYGLTVEVLGTSGSLLLLLLKLSSSPFVVKDFLTGCCFADLSC